MHLNKLKGNRGFTLVELLVVVAIVGILAAIAIPKFASASDSAKIAKIQADLRSIQSAIEIYNAEVGTYPANLNALTQARTVDGISKGPWLASVPTPPNGNIGASKIPANYSYSTTNHVASITVGSVTYNADGTVNNNPTP